MWFYMMGTKMPLESHLRPRSITPLGTAVCSDPVTHLSERILTQKETVIRTVGTRNITDEIYTCLRCAYSWTGNLIQLALIKITWNISMQHCKKQLMIILCRSSNFYILIIYYILTRKRHWISITSDHPPNTWHYHYLEPILKNTCFLG